MKKQNEIEVKVGLFVSIGMMLVMLAILALGSTENLLTRKDRYSAHFSSAEGLIEGAKVVLGGIQVGTVEKIGFDMKTRDILVTFTVKKDSADWIRTNSTVEIATQGLLGDKFVSIEPGTLEHPELSPGTPIPNRPSKNIAQFLNKGDQLMVSLNSLAISLDHTLKTFSASNRSEIFFQGMATSAKNLASATEKLDRELDEMRLKKIMRSLDQILEKINNGTGSLGALVNDPGLYDDAKKLVGEANRSRIMRNLVRQTLKNAEKNEKNPR